jgi:hypothetical protein
LKGSATAGVVAGLASYAFFGLSWQQSAVTGAIPPTVAAFVTRNSRKIRADRTEREASRRLRWFDWIFYFVFTGGILSSLAVVGTVMLLRHAGQDPARGSILIAFDLVLIWRLHRSRRRNREISQEARFAQPSLGN